MKSSSYGTKNNNDKIYISAIAVCTSKYINLIQNKILNNRFCYMTNKEKQKTKQTDSRLRSEI